MLATWDAQKRCLRWGTQYLGGLNLALKTCFFPSYTPPRGQSAWTPRAARQRGIRLDRWMASWTQHYPHQPQLAGPKPPQLAVIWAEIVRRGWRPVAAQVPLGDGVTRCGTRLDCVCEYQGRFILLEIKTGYENYNAPAEPMLPPLVHVSSSPQHQHQLYLQVARHWWQQHYPDRPVAGCYIWRVDDQLTLHQIDATELVVDDLLPILTKLQQITTWNRRQRLAQCRKKKKRRLGC